MDNTEKANLQHKKEIQNILNYFVKEGMAKEVSPGEYVLTEEGKKISAVPL